MTLPVPQSVRLACETASPEAVEVAFVARIRLRARRSVLYARHLWTHGVTAADTGLAISHSEVDRLLDDPKQTREAEQAFYRTDPAACELTSAIAEADRRAWEDTSLSRIRERLLLTDAESDMLTLCVAAEIAPGLRRVFGYLNDETAPSLPTPALGARLFDWPASMRFGPSSALARFLLARPVTDTGGGFWSSGALWMADPFAVGLLAEGKLYDEALGDAITRADDRAIPSLCLYPDALEQMAAFAGRVTSRGAFFDWGASSDAPIEIVLTGPAGVGKRTLAAQFQAHVGGPLLIVDAGRLGTESEALERARRVARMAFLSGSALYWDRADAAPGSVWEALRGIPTVGVTLYGTDGPAPVGAPEAVRRVWTLRPLTRAARIALYCALTQSDMDAPEPVAERAMTPGQIAVAARLSGAGDEAIREACRPLGLRAEAALANSLPCPYTWDDLVLTSSVRQHLDEVEAQMRHRWSVYEEWGMERLCPIGRGITMLFSGPSGTGKTMAAQVLARSLGMELWRIDLAGVVSKYIGETEKNLKQVFDAAERAHVLLFFDEADALFGKRTEVKDAHDRFANIEIDYLLQRMERFDGLAILATNRRGDLDPAFLRRLRFSVDFAPPGAPEREILWRKALDAGDPTADKSCRAPLADDVDWAWLAAKLNLTGAEIKSVALAAAFLARERGTRIGMRQILHAAQRELTKKGATVRPEEFREWEDG